MDRSPQTKNARTMVAAAVLLGGVALMLVVAALPWETTHADASVIPKDQYMAPPGEPEPSLDQVTGQDDNVRVVVEKFYASFANTDSSSMTALWMQDADATLVRPEVVPVRGWSSVKDALGTLAGKIDARPSELRLRVGTKTAEVAALERVHLVGSDGGAGEMENISITILKREGDSWKVAAHRAVPREGATPVPATTGNDSEAK